MTADEREKFLQAMERVDARDLTELMNEHVINIAEVRQILGLDPTKEQAQKDS